MSNPRVDALIAISCGMSELGIPTRNALEMAAIVENAAHPADPRHGHLMCDHGPPYHGGIAHKCDGEWRRKVPGWAPP